MADQQVGRYGGRRQIEQNLPSGMEWQPGRVVEPPQPSATRSYLGALASELFNRSRDVLTLAPDALRWGAGQAARAILPESVQEEWGLAEPGAAPNATQRSGLNIRPGESHADWRGRIQEHSQAERAKNDLPEPEAAPAAPDPNIDPNRDPAAYLRGDALKAHRVKMRGLGPEGQITSPGLLAGQFDPDSVVSYNPAVDGVITRRQIEQDQGVRDFYAARRQQREGAQAERHQRADETRRQLAEERSTIAGSGLDRNIQVRSLMANLVQQKAELEQAAERVRALREQTGEGPTDAQIDARLQQDLQQLQRDAMMLGSLLWGKNLQGDQDPLAGLLAGGSIPGEAE